MDTKKLGGLLAKRRNDAGMTQIQVANLAKISRRTISALEAGEAEIGLRRLLRICLVLGLELDLIPSSDRPTEDMLRSFFKDDDDE